MSFYLNSRSVLAEHESALSIRERLSEAVQLVPAKVLARITGRTPQAATRWKAADNSMTIETLFALAREIPDVWEIVRAECGRAHDVTEAEAMLAKMRALLIERKDHAAS